MKTLFAIEQALSRAGRPAGSRDVDRTASSLSIQQILTGSKTRSSGAKDRIPRVEKLRSERIHPRDNVFRVGIWMRSWPIIGCKHRSLRTELILLRHSKNPRARCFLSQAWTPALQPRLLLLPRGLASSRYSDGNVGHSKIGGKDSAFLAPVIPPFSICSLMRNNVSRS